MATLESLIKDRIERLESVPDALQGKIDKQNIVLFKALLKELDSLKIVDGKIETSTDNLAKVAQIVNKLKDVLFGGDYVDAIKEFATEISKQATLNNQILDEVAGGFEDSEVYKATIKSAQHNALLLLDENAVQANLLQPISELLTNSIINNSSFLDMVETLRGSMVGDAAIYSKYTSTYLKDAFASADRQYSQLTSRQHGIEFYRYDGGHIDDTRGFCLERVNKIFHHDEIAAMGDNINTRPSEFEFPAKSPVYINKNGVKLYWFGCNYDTNAATIFSYAGGYNCRHILVPIDIRYVPQSAIDKAIELNFYHP